MSNLFKTMFSMGIPEREERRNHDMTFIYPEELIDKTCGGCVRCELRHRPRRGEEKPDGYHCMMRDWDIDVSPDHKACVGYWDKAEHERVEKLRAQDTENRRNELWAIYAERDPIELPIVNDGYGRIPKCPVCGEMPYSTEQCHWCGQRFIQNDEVEEYGTPLTKPFKCPSCGTVGTANVSRYNGHKHFHCEKCGLSFME